MNHEILLQTLLHGLKEGVIVCDPEARITLFNKAAAELFGGGQSFSCGDSLYRLCLQAPVEHALNLLHFQQQVPKSLPGPHPYVQFMNTTSGQEKFFRCRASFLPAKTGQKDFFVIIFEDVSTSYRPDNPLFMKIEEFRAPMTNLRAAVENLTEHPEMSPVMRSAFENVLVQESLNLTDTFDSLAHACNLLLQTQSHLTEMNTEVLFGYVAHCLRSKKISIETSTDRPTNVKVDSFGLVLVLDYLARKILRERKLNSLACQTHIGENFIYFDFIWDGDFLPTTLVESMLRKKLKSSVGELTVASILHSMEGDIWSQQQENTSGTLRLALPITLKID